MKELEKRLNDELEKIFINNTTIHIVAARKQAIKNLNLKIANPYTKKGFREPKNCLKWGCQAGYDNIFYIKLK